MRAWKQDCFFSVYRVSLFLCLPFIPLSIALAEYFAACALSHGFVLCDYIKVIMRYLLRFYLCFLISFHSRFEILFFLLFIRHSFMDTWLSRLHWEFENNQFFPLCCFCCCNSDTNTQITRSNRMNVFWSRNRCSFLLLLFLFSLGALNLATKKRTKIEHTHIDIRLTCIYTWNGVFWFGMEHAMHKMLRLLDQKYESFYKYVQRFSAWYF